MIIQTYTHTDIGENRTNNHRPREPKRGISSITALQRLEVSLEATVCSHKSKNQKEKSKDK